MITRRHLIGSLAVAAFAARPAFGAPTAVFASSGYAIGGYDPVSYFRNESPAMGSDAHRLIWRKAIWRFQNAANMAAFEGAPRAFAPRFGGYCAMSLTVGAWSDSLPQARAIHTVRVDLTHSTAARDRWLTDPERHIALAEAHWRAAHW